MAGASGSKKRARRTRRRPNPAALLTDDILVEILARAPYRSVCRFRCVCSRWRALIDDPDNRARLPQTLAGFLYHMPVNAAAAGRSPAWRPSSYGFASVSGNGPPLIDASFSFLPDRERESLYLQDGCNGLLLFLSYRSTDRYELDYLVINPATEKWVTMPVTPQRSDKVKTVRLGFDPAVSPHFYIFEFQMDDDAEFGQVLGVNFYSSATGVWIHKKSNWSKIMLHFKSVFLNGVLYVEGTSSAVGAMDVEGETWTIIEVPRSSGSLIDQSQGGCILQYLIIWSIG